MPTNRAVRRQAVTYAVLVALSLLLLALTNSAPLLDLRRGVGFAMAPLQQSLRSAARNATSVFSTIAELDALRHENETLQQQVQELQVTNAQLESLRHQNEQLTALLGVQSALNFDTVAAEVISRAGAANERTITIDRGADSGISVDDPVVAGGGALVGQVVAVGANYANVLLISDTRSTVIGLTATSAAEGDIVGQLERPLAMQHIMATEAVAVGEQVVTAGIDLGGGIRSPFPKGLVIGTVVEMQASPDQLFQTALLNPTAPLDHLEYVLVITNYEPQQPIDLPSPSPAAP